MAIIPSWKGSSSRLINAQDLYGHQSYQYDPNSNRTQTTQNNSTDHYSYSSDNHQLSHLNGNAYHYDANGHITQLPRAAITTDLRYGDHNRLVSVNGITYTYNGQGQRVKKANDTGQAIEYHYHQNGQLIAETDALGNTQKEYLYQQGQLIAIATSEVTRTTPPEAVQEIDVTDRWRSIDYAPTGTQPVIIAGVPSYHGKHAGVIRIKNVTATQAKIAFKEWNYLDGHHRTEQVSFMALTPGRHTMPDGSIWEVGRFTLNGTKNWTTQTFDSPFSAAPRVFLTAQTANGSDVVSLRAKAITRTRFKAALYEQDSLNHSGHVNETIGYLAIYSSTREGTATIHGINTNYALASRRLNHNFRATLNHRLKLEEEQSKDRERQHLFETVAVLSVKGHIFAQDNSSKGGDTIAIRRNSSTPQRQAMGISTAAPTDIFYVHNDHLGTPQVITNKHQDIVWQAQYDPFGQATITTERIVNNIRFPGQYFDTETGLHYNYYRYYDPETGRYITSDPIGLSGGTNTYGYVGGNPANLSDPYGLCPWCAVGAVISGGLNAYSQYQANRGFNNFNWGAFLASTATGALGGGLGTAASRLTWRAAGSTWQLSAAGQLAVNSAGSTAIGAGVTAAQNKLTGSCNSVSGAAINGLLAGGLGAGFGSGISNVFKAVNQANYNSLSLSTRLLFGSNALHGVNHPIFLPGGVTLGNALGNTVANLPVYQSGTN